MYFKVSFNEDFDTLMMHLWSKYGREIFDIDGIGKQCDMNWFAQNFFNTNKTTADNSIDSNSNVTDKSVNVFNVEFPKPYLRYNSYYLLWKELRKLYGLEKANTIIEDQLIGRFYINDFHNVGMPYCYNFSTYDIALSGLPMISKIYSEPPKHLYSFKSQVEQFTIIAANATLGATGLADLLVVMSHYIENILISGADAHFKFNSEEDIWTYVKETLFSMIFTFNQPTRASQSCFTNISLFDDVFLEKLCKDYVFTRGGETVTANKDIVKKLQTIYCDVMNETLRRTPCTFPVTTACFAIDDNNDILDNDFVDLIAEKNLEFGFINIFSGKSSVLSSCCFKGDETIEVFNEELSCKETFKLKDFVGIFNDNKHFQQKIDKKYKIKSLNPNTLKEEETYITGVLKKENEYKELIEFTVNGKSIKVTPDHEFLVKNIKTDKIEKVVAEVLYNNLDKFLVPVII